MCVCGLFPFVVVVVLFFVLFVLLVVVLFDSSLCLFFFFLSQGRLFSMIKNQEYLFVFCKHRKFELRSWAK